MQRDIPHTSLNARTCGGVPRAVKTPHPFVSHPSRLEKSINRNGAFMRSTYSPSNEIGPGDQGLRDQNRPVECGALAAAQPHSAENHRARPWWAISYGALLLAFLLLVSLTWTQCDFSNPEIPDWKPVLALAEAAREKRDRYYAKHLYLRAAKFAVWRDDWAGLLAAACGTQILERERGQFSSTHALLLRAMVVAEKRQSRSGLVAVAKAFAALGNDKVASMVLSRVGKDSVAETDDSADVASLGCWGKKNEKQLSKTMFTWAQRSLIRENGFCEMRLMLGDGRIL